MADIQTIKASAEAAQSLKLYRRAELLNESDQLLIEQLYVDPLQNDGVLDTLYYGPTPPS